MPSRLSHLACLLILLFALLGCSSQQDDPKLYLLTMDELEEYLKEATETQDRGIILAELMTREILPDRVHEIFDEITSSKELRTTANLAHAYAAKSRILFHDSPPESLDYANKALLNAVDSQRVRALASARFAKGRFLWMNDEWEDAFKNFKELSEFSSQHNSCLDFQIRALNGMGAIAMAKGASGRSRDLFQQGLDLEGSIGQEEAKLFPAINLGLLRWRIGEYQSAVAALLTSIRQAKLVERRNWIVEAYRAAAACSLEIEELDDAKEYIALAKVQIHQLPQRNVDQVRLTETVIHAVAGLERKETLIQDATRIVDGLANDDRTRSRALVDLSRVHAAFGDFAKAIEVISTVPELEREEDHVHLIYALNSKLHYETQDGRLNDALETAKELQFEYEQRFARQMDLERQFSAFEVGLSTLGFEAREQALSAAGAWLKWLLVGLATAATVGGLFAFVLLRRTRTMQRNAESLSERTEEEKQELAVEVAKLESSLNQKRRLEAIGQLTGGVAHDFNNLLTVIMGTNELLLLEAENDSSLRSQSPMIEQSVEAAKLGAQITQQLLAFSRKQQLRPERTDVKQLLVDTKGLLERSISPLNCLSIRFPSGKPFYVEIDKAQMTTALINLCSNARDALLDESAASISITVKEEELDGSTELMAGKYYCITTSDNGQGMSPQEVERAFEPFFTTKSHASGTGLGLSTVHGFVKQSGGDLRIESEPNKGTDVHILLPSAQTALDSDSANHSETQRNVSSVLVVDDDPGVREALNRMLDVFGIEARFAMDATSAKQLLMQQPMPDVVLSDIRMRTPQEGLEFAQWVKEEHPESRVVLMSGYYDSSGIDAFRVLSKPFTKDELLTALRRA